MRYRNPQPPEGINVSRAHPLKEFLLLGGGALLLVVLFAFLLGQFGGRLARLLPFEYEAEIAPVEMLSSDAPEALQAYLDGLAGRLAAHMDLPPGMQYRLHVSGDDTYNAFATLGGNVLLFRGLLEALPHENALAMLLAHEIAHVVHRDPIAGIGQGAAVQLVFGLLFGDPNLAVIGSAGLYTQLHFNRSMERAADGSALAAVYGVYGHVAGARALFDTILAARSDSGELPAIFSSHPLDRERIEAIARTADERDWPVDGAVTPLPPAYRDWLEQTRHEAEAGDRVGRGPISPSSPAGHRHRG